MLSLDQFESAFRAAARSQYIHRPLCLERILVVTDLPQERADRYAERAAPFFQVRDQHPTLTALGHDHTADLGKLIEQVKEREPDLIVTYRCLHSPAWRWPYTVGDHIEVLTQITDIPVLLLPRIDTGDADQDPLQPPKVVMAMTDHLVGDAQLVRWAAGLCPPGEWLVLAHVEDEVVFNRYMDLIGKIPEIETTVAVREIRERLFKEVREWIRHCRAVLHERLDDQAPRIEEAITLGHLLKTYRDIVIEREAELLVLNTKDDDQLAIHGMAYPLMIELRRIPLLLL